MTYQLEHKRRGSGFWIMGKAGEELPTKRLIYKGADGAWFLADADTNASLPALGITQERIPMGQAGSILTLGIIGFGGWSWTPGEDVYASTTAGELTQTAPVGVGDIVQVIGVATKSNLIYFQPHFAPSDAGPRYAEAHITAGGLITIDTTDVWHAITGFTSDSSLGVTFNAGATGAITAFANAGGGQVTVTSAGHPLVNGDIVTIAGTTNYNGIFTVSNVVGNDFEITSAFNGNDGVGTWRNGSNFVVPIAASYFVSWQISASSAGNAKIFIFTISINDTIITPGIQRRKFAAGGDVGSASGSFICECSAGDIITFNLQNESDATNITFEQATFNVHRMS